MRGCEVLITDMKTNPTKGITIYICSSARDRHARYAIITHLEQHAPFIRVLPDTLTDEPFSKPWLLRTSDRIRRADFVLFLAGETSWLESHYQWQLLAARSLHRQRVIMKVHHGEIPIPLHKGNTFQEPVVPFKPQALTSYLQQHVAFA
jgi:hypothetical protein